MNRRCLGLTVVILAIGLLQPAFLPASKKGLSLTHEEISTAWIGISDNELYLYRLVLEEDGTGYGGFVYRTLEPVLFEITSWRLDRDLDLTVEYVASNGEGYPTSMRAKLVGAKMTLLVRGSDWKYRVHLRREQALVRDWENLSGSMRNQWPEKSQKHPR